MDIQTPKLTVPYIKQSFKRKRFCSYISDSDTIKTHSDKEERQEKNAKEQPALHIMRRLGNLWRLMMKNSMNKASL